MKANVANETYTSSRHAGHHWSDGSCSFVLKQWDGDKRSIDDDSYDEDDHQQYLMKNDKKYNKKFSFGFFASFTMTRMTPLPAAILLIRTALGNDGSLMPVIGFFSRYGALAAKSGLGRSSSS